MTGEACRRAAEITRFGAVRCLPAPWGIPLKMWIGRLTAPRERCHPKARGSRHRAHLPALPQLPKSTKSGDILLLLSSRLPEEMGTAAGQAASACETLPSSQQKASGPNPRGDIFVLREGRPARYFCLRAACAGCDGFPFPSSPPPPTHEPAPRQLWCGFYCRSSRPSAGSGLPFLMLIPFPTFFCLSSGRTCGISARWPCCTPVGTASLRGVIARRGCAAEFGDTKSSSPGVLRA